MIIFPSGESKTESVSVPWGSVILCVLAISTWFLVVHPENKKYQAQMDLAMEHVIGALEADHRDGRLSDTLLNQTVNNPSLIVSQQHSQTYSQTVRDRYLVVMGMELPLRQLSQESSFKRLLVGLAPHDLTVLILGLVCLLLLGYVFEHMYDPMITLGMYAVIAASWFLLEHLAPGLDGPDVVFAWANTIAVMVLAFWLRAPTALITLTFRTWLGKVVELRFGLAATLLPLLYFTSLTLVNTRFSPYREVFSPESGLVVLAEAVILLVILWFVPAKGSIHETPEMAINRDLSRAEGFMNEDRRQDALDILHALITHEPNTQQMRRIAELAFQGDDDDLTRRAYHQLLKEQLNSQDYFKLVQLIEEIAYRGVPLPASILINSLNISLRNKRYADILKLLPYFDQHKDVDEEDILRFYTQFVDKLLSSMNPSKQQLLEVMNRLESIYPKAPSIQQIRLYFKEQQSNSESLRRMSNLREIHRHVDISIMEITRSEIRIRINEKDQNIPWSAVEGAFGSYMRGMERGYRGCVFVKFKRKIFACNFTKTSIMLKDRLGQPLTFEHVWDLIKDNIPEDAPFLEMEAFKELLDAPDFDRLAEEFINQ